MAIEKVTVPRKNKTGHEFSEILSLLSGIPRLKGLVEELNPILLERSEHQLEQVIVEMGKDDPGMIRILSLLKITFWEEFKRAQNERRKMTLLNVARGICSKKYFYAQIAIPEVLAWIMVPPAEEMLLQKELVALGMRRLREVMVQDIHTEKISYTKDENGEPIKLVRREVNVPLVKEMHNIIKTMQDRIHGSVLQRQHLSGTINQQIDQRSVNVSMTPEQAREQALAAAQGEQKSLPLQSDVLSLESLEEFDRKLSEVAAKLEGMEIDAEIEED